MGWGDGVAYVGRWGAAGRDGGGMERGGERVGGKRGRKWRCRGWGRGQGYCWSAD